MDLEPEGRRATASPADRRKSADFRLTAKPVSAPDVCCSVVRAFDQLKQRGLSEGHALRAAHRLFAYHEPHLPARLAAAIVRGIALDREQEG